MKLHLETPEGVNLITGHDPGSIAVNGERHTLGLIVMPDRLITPWGGSDVAVLTVEDIDTLAALPVAIVLIGTGLRQQFPPTNLLRPLIATQRGFEIMDTAAACRTYTILASEGRSVAAALLPNPG